MAIPLTADGSNSGALARTRTRSWFFPAMGGVAVLAVAIGFGRTYFAPMARGTFAAPLVLHIHGAFAIAWVLLFAVQPMLVRMRQVKWHRRIGLAGLPLAIGVATTMLPAGVFQATRDAAAGAGPTGISAILGVMTSAIMFVALVGAGVLTRKNRDAHARWMLLATLVVIWPAWFRFRHWFPAVPRPEVWFALVLADVWIVVAMIRDRVTRGAIHPVLLWGGTAVIVEQSLEVIMFDSPSWRVAAQWLYEMLSGVGAGLR